jgi:fibronectin type 3 domain-containing protein
MVIDGLIPGRQYQIDVVENSGTSAEYIYNLPESALADPLYNTPPAVDVNGQTIYQLIYVTGGYGDNNLNLTASADGKVVLMFGATTGYDSDIITGVIISHITAIAPPAPTGLNAVGGCKQVTLSWNASYGATCYNVKRSMTSGAETTIASPTTTGYTDMGLGDSTTYYYLVTAVNSAGESGNSSEVNATTVPPAPTGLQAVGGNGQVTLSWTASAGATSYNVKRSTSSGAETTIASATTTGYTNTGLANGTTYYYVVTAVNSAGESGPSSEVNETIVITVPPAPTGLQAVGGNGQVILGWTASVGATSYNVKRSTSSGAETTITSATTTGYTNMGMANGMKYYYEISAVNAAGESVNSSEVNATPGVPPDYNRISCQLLSGGARLSFLGNPGAYYALERTFNLSPANWVPQVTNPACADGTLVFTNTPDPTTNNFWRIRLVTSMGVIIFQDNFDPQNPASGIGSYSGGDATNVSVGVVSGVGSNGSAALQIKCSFNNGPNYYGFLGGLWWDLSVSGNTDTNLSDYVLSFDAYVTGDASHQSGGGFMLMIQESAGQYWAPTFPQGILETYQPYQGGSDLQLPQSGVWQHFSINLGGPTFQGANGLNSNFDPTGGTWLIGFQMNAADWGSELQTGSTLVIDNLVLTDFTPP